MPTPLSRDPTAPSSVPPSTNPPKSRPPTSLRDRLPFSTALPYYSGPYSVGTIDIEVPVRDPRTFSNITRHGKHLLKLDTALFSVFYPSKIGSGQGLSPEGKKNWGRPTWLPRPRGSVARGYGQFAGMPEWGAAGWFGVTTAFTKLPAYSNAPLATHWPPPQNAHEGGYKMKNKAGEAPPGEPEAPCFPLLVFSHGLGGMRTAYSSVCGEFASYGFIVVAVEHRDGSGPRTFVNLRNQEMPAEKSEQDVDSAGSGGGDRADDAGNRKNPSKGKEAKTYSRMDYVFPKDNAKDTMPGNKQGVDGELRAAQIQLRLAEIEEAYHVMTLIHSGQGESAARASMRCKKYGDKGGSSRGLQGMDWNSWKDRFHLKQITMLGHSFGGAAAIEVLRHRDRFKNVGQGIIYDIWGGAIQPPEDDLGHRIHTPMLGINSEAFMYWPDNFSAVMSLCKEAKEQDQLAWLMTVRGSVHISQSDFSLLYPRIASLLLKMTVNPRRAIDLNINASLEFLKLVMPDRISAMNRGTNEHLLEVDALDELPSIHRPSDKWTAVRLRIPHELRIRLTPQWVRRYTRRKKRKDATEQLPKDPQGHILEGLEELELGEEIWMHVAPTKDELAKHGLKPSKELETHQSSGMVDEGGADDCGEEQRHQHRGIEQRMMERG